MALGFFIHVLVGLYGLCTVPGQVLEEDQNSNKLIAAILVLSVLFVLTLPLFFFLFVGSSVMVADGVQQVRMRLDGWIEELGVGEGAIEGHDSESLEEDEYHNDKWMRYVLEADRRIESLFMNEAAFPACGIRALLARLGAGPTFCLCATFVFCIIGWPVVLWFSPVFLSRCLVNYDNRGRGWGWGGTSAQQAPQGALAFSMLFLYFAVLAWLVWIFPEYFFPGLCPHSYLKGTDYTVQIFQHPNMSGYPSCGVVAQGLEGEMVPGCIQNSTKVYYKLNLSRADESFPCLFTRCLMYVVYVIEYVFKVMGCITNTGACHSM